MSVIDVRDLHVSFGETVAVDGVSFSVKRSEVFAIVGPNGAGKTSTVEAMYGLRHRDGGTVRILGLDPQREREAVCALVGVQLQQASLPERLRVHEALELYASLYGSNVNWQQLIEEWGLADKRKATFGSLSGGQKQRLFIAIALVSDPEIVFLDEITTGLDPKARRATLDLVRKLQENGKTVVIVSHYLDEVEELADRVAIINHGRLVALDSPSGLCRSQAGETVVRFSAPMSYQESALRSVKGVHRVERVGARITLRGTGAILAHAAAALVGSGHAPEDLSVQRPNLEQVYFALTGATNNEVTL